MHALQAISLLFCSTQAVVIDTDFEANRTRRFNEMVKFNQLIGLNEAECLKINPGGNTYAWANKAQISPVCFQSLADHGGLEDWWGVSAAVLWNYYSPQNIGGDLTTMCGDDTAMIEANWAEDGTLMVDWSGSTSIIGERCTAQDSDYGWCNQCRCGDEPVCNDMTQFCQNWPVNQMCDPANPRMKARGGTWCKCCFIMTEVCGGGNSIGDNPAGSCRNRAQAFVKFVGLYAVAYDGYVSHGHGQTPISYEQAFAGFLEPGAYVGCSCHIHPGQNHNCR